MPARRSRRWPRAGTREGASQLFQDLSALLFELAHAFLLAIERFFELLARFLFRLDGLFGAIARALGVRLQDLGTCQRTLELAERDDELLAGHLGLGTPLRR